jgi:hypothetical protein
VTPAFQAVKNRLQASSGRDFENVVFPWLKILYPELVHPSGLKDLDKKGVDMGYVVPGKVFPVVIQCKGFEVTVDELGKGHVEQLNKSVRRFIKAGLRTKLYVALTNRTGKNRAFATQAEACIEKLKTSGAASKASLWSVDEFIRAVEKRLTSLVVDALQEWSTRVDEARSRIFTFDEFVVDDVPAMKRKWVLEPGAEGGEIKAEQPLSPAQLRDELLVAEEGRFSLVIGSYGIGKSTLMRTFEVPKGFARVLIPAADLLHVRYSGGSQTALLQHLLKHTQCLQPLADATSIPLQELERVGGACLGAAFQSAKCKAVLIIDGLDENAIYARAEGFRRLAGELRRLRIPVVVTTRKEHFFNRYLDISHGDQQVWLSRRIETSVVELTDWSAATCVKMLDRVASVSSSNREALQPLRDIVIGGELPLIARHPLWLAMAMDLALAGEGEILLDHRALYHRWTESKYLRDFSTPGREIPEKMRNAAVFVANLSDLMTRVAAKLAKPHEGVLELSPEIEAEDVEAIATEHLGTHNSSDVLFAETSLLTPTSIRTAAGMKLRFAHFSFQEFYTALAIEQGLVLGKFETSPGVASFIKSPPPGARESKSRSSV